MSKRLIVTYKTIRFLPRDTETGESRNEEINVKIVYPSVEYNNWLKNARNTGLNKIEILEVKEEVTRGKDYKKIETPEEISNDLKKALENRDTRTPEQRQIDELKEQIARLTNARNEPPKVEPKNDELSKAREEYQNKLGKKPHHSWDVETIKSKLEEAK